MGSPVAGPAVDMLVDAGVVSVELAAVVAVEAEVAVSLDAVDELAGETVVVVLDPPQATATREISRMSTPTPTITSALFIAFSLSRPERSDSRCSDYFRNL